MKITEKEYSSLKKSSDKEKAFGEILQAIEESQKADEVRSKMEAESGDSIEKILAATLLRFSVLEDDIAVEKFLLEKHKADPRIKDATTGESALICALDKGNFKAIKLFDSGHYELQPIDGDYITIGSIYSAITSDHGYDTQDLLGALSHLYSGLDEVF